MLWDDLQRIRAERPLVHNITNYVVMNLTANALLATGAAPVMAHALGEVEEMAGLASSLVLNIGTLSPDWIEAMALAGRVAKARGIPVVLDPVGAGATAMRTATALRLLDEAGPRILRGNASEIRALGALEGGARGVDATHSVDSVAEVARELSRRWNCVVSVSGPVDLVVQDGRLARIHNGDPVMARVTGMGCTATAVTGAFAAVQPDPFLAACAAMVFLGVAGEMAVRTAPGPGSFPAALLDAMAAMTGADLDRLQRIEGLDQPL